MSRLPGNWAGVSALNPFLQKLSGSRTPTLFMDNDPQSGQGVRQNQCSAASPGAGLLVTTRRAMEGVLVGSPDRDPEVPICPPAAGPIGWATPKN